MARARAEASMFSTMDEDGGREREKRKEKRRRRRKRRKNWPGEERILSRPMDRRKKEFLVWTSPTGRAGGS